MSTTILAINPMPISLLVALFKNAKFSQPTTPLGMFNTVVMDIGKLMEIPEIIPVIRIFKLSSLWKFQCTYQIEWRSDLIRIASKEKM